MDLLIFLNQSANNINILKNMNNKPSQILQRIKNKKSQEDSVRTDLNLIGIENILHYKLHALNILKKYCQNQTIKNFI